MTTPPGPRVLRRLAVELRRASSALARLAQRLDAGGRADVGQLPEGGPPEQWLAVVRKHAPGLLRGEGIGVSRPVPDRTRSGPTDMVRWPPDASARRTGRVDAAAPAPWAREPAVTPPQPVPDVSASRRLRLPARATRRVAAEWRRRRPVSAERVADPVGGAPGGADGPAGWMDATVGPTISARFTNAFGRGPLRARPRVGGPPETTPPWAGPDSAIADRPPNGRRRRARWTRSPGDPATPVGPQTRLWRRGTAVARPWPIAWTVSGDGAGSARRPTPGEPGPFHSTRSARPGPGLTRWTSPDPQGAPVSWPELAHHVSPAPDSPSATADPRGPWPRLPDDEPPFTVTPLWDDERVARLEHEQRGL